MPRLRRAGAMFLMLYLAGSGASRAETSGPTVIHAKVWSTHDRISPPIIKDQIILEDFTFTLSGVNDVNEDYTFGVISDANTARVRIPPFHAGGSSRLGVDGGKVAWSVTGPHSLRRINQGMQVIKIMDFEIGPGGACRLNVKYLLQKGKTTILAVRQDNHEVGEFTLNRVVRTECSAS